MDELEAKACLNCGVTMNGEFCYNCGQKDIPKRLTWKEVRNDVIGSLFGVQKGFLKTFKDMSLKPGETVRAYLSGHRKLYQSPVQYYLIATTLLFIGYNYFHFMEALQDGTFNAQLQGVDKVDPKQQKVLERMRPIFNNLRIVVAFVTPMLALSYKWFFGKKSGYTYIEHLVFAVFVTAHSSFLSLPIAPLSAMLGSSTMWLSTLLSFLYITWAVKVFYKTNWFKAIVSYFVGYSLFMLLFTFVVVIPFMIYIIANKGLV